MPDGKVNDKFDFAISATKTSLTKKEMTFRFLTDLLSLFYFARRRDFGCVGQMVFVAMSLQTLLRLLRWSKQRDVGVILQTPAFGLHLFCFACIYLSVRQKEVFYE